MSSPPVSSRSVRSFVLRQGRITRAQRHALEHLWPIYGLDSETPLHAENLFGRKAPLFLDIGFGNGENLAANAQRNPNNDYIGIEVHKPGIGHLMKILRDHEIENVRIYDGDAVDITKRLMADESIAGINLFFPDPWPKKRHHKRRLVNKEFVELIVHRLESGGFFHAATDWDDYAQQIGGILENHPELESGTDLASSQELIAQRSMTRFERRGLARGHKVSDIVFRKRAKSESCETQAGVQKPG